MSTPVVMPQMGESIAEGTIVRWIKKVGDNVDRDEPLFEISTDKVDAEIPSPAAGTLLEIKVKEGETVSVNSIVATIGGAGEKAAVAEVAETPPPSGKTAPAKPQADGSPASAPASAPAASAPARADAQASAAEPSSASARTGIVARYGETSPKPPSTVSGEGGPKQPEVQARDGAPPSPSDDERRQRSSPLVRKIASEHGVDISQITGSGIGGRVTKNDILGYIERAPAPTRTAPEAPPAQARPPSLAQDSGASVGVAGRPEPSAPAAAAADRIEPMSIMRKKIAEHMVLSTHTSAHVYSVFEVNYHRVDQIRSAHKSEYEQKGVKLTYTAFIAKVAIDCLRRHPVINASIDGDTIVYKRAINLGIAVALENGLIVPVIKRADEVNLLGLSRAIADVADRARARKLNPDEVHGGTFTITNPGNFGAQFGLPIINQPQVAILGVGTIEKRAVVIDDMIGIRLMGYLTLGYDHRLVDGAVADQFMADVKKGLETFDPSQV